MMVWWMEIFTQKNVHPPQSFNTHKKGEKTTMEEKKNKMIVEMVEKLRQMDSNSLVIMKASVDILAAKERLDKEEAKTA